MTDEQTELLREILNVSREHLESTKRYRDDAMALQRTALERQASQLRLAKYAIGFLCIVVVVYLTAIFWVEKEQVPPAPAKTMPNAAEPV